MTLKNSFLASLRENMKRRMWVLLLNLMVFVFGMPTLLAMSLSSIKSRNAHLYQSFSDSVADEKIRTMMTNDIQGFIGINSFPILAFVVAVIAVVIGIQGFSYLYHRNKIDFYMGMPVKRSARFFKIWFNGFFLYLLPTFLGFALSILIGVLNHAMPFEMFKEVCLNFFLLILVFFGSYHLAILAVMLTGNVIITFFATIIFFVYEEVLHGIVQSYETLFFKQYSSMGKTYSSLVSPLFIYERFAGEYNRQQGSPIFTAIYLLLFAVVLLGICYVTYLNRPAEAAGKAMAFKKSEPIIKVLLVVPFSLLAGIFASEMVNYSPTWGNGNPGFMIFIMAVSVIVVSCFIQVLYEFDVKAILRKKSHILIAGIFTTVIFLGFRFDVLGYDTYLPKVDKVSSVVLNTPYEYAYRGSWEYLDTNGRFMPKEEYMMENMYLTDPGAVNMLVKKSIDYLKEQKDLSKIYEDISPDSRWLNMDVVYRMNNRRTISRNIYVNLKDEETCKILDKIMSSEEYIDSVQVAKVEGVENLITSNHPDKKIKSFYGNDIFEDEISIEEAKQILQYYKEDMKQFSFYNIYNQFATGSLSFEIERRESSYYTTSNIEFKVYSFMKNTISYLDEKGYYRDKIIDADEVEKIIVTNYHNEENDAASEKELMEDEYLDQSVKHTYSDKESIKKICEKIYPSGWSYGQWTIGNNTDDNYMISVYFKTDLQISEDFGGYATYCFLENEVPDFVSKDTALK